MSPNDDIIHANRRFASHNVQETQTRIMAIPEMSSAEGTASSRTTTFTEASASIRSPTETEFTSILNSEDHFKIFSVESSPSIGDVNSVSFQSHSSGSSKGALKTGQPKTRSVGRGGAGNIFNTETLELDLIEEANILRRRRLVAQSNPRVKVSNTGRGGTGNILAASGSTPYDPSRDPDDEYEKIVHTEAQKKRMQQRTVLTGRGGSGNVNVRAPSNDNAKPRNRSQSLSIFGGKKKKKTKDPASIRPSTASTIASNASSEREQFELRDRREYTIASRSEISTAKCSDPYTAFNGDHSPITSTTSLTTLSSAGPSSTNDTPYRLAISSAPPPQPVWRSQYQKPPPREINNHKLVESPKEKEEIISKWWKKSSKRGENDLYSRYLSDAPYKDEQLKIQRLNPGQASNITSPQVAMDPRHGLEFVPTSEFPRIPMRNPYIPSHVNRYDPANSESSDSLSPGQTQVLNKVRMLAESKLSKNGVFDMNDLEEILAQAAHLRKQETVYDFESEHLQLFHFPHPPPRPPPPPPAPAPPQTSAAPKSYSSSRLNLNQYHLQPQPQPQLHHARPSPYSLPQTPTSRSEHPFPPLQARTPYNHTQIQQDSEFHHSHRSEKKNVNSENGRIYPSSTIRQIHKHSPHIGSPPGQSNHSLDRYVPPISDSGTYVYKVPVPPSDGRGTQSSPRKSALSSRKEYDRFEVPPQSTVLARNLLEQGTSSALKHLRIMDEYYEQVDFVSGLPRQGHITDGREIRESTTNRYEDEIDETSRSLDPVNEEEDIIYIVEEEEPYTSFIDI